MSRIVKFIKMNRIQDLETCFNNIVNYTAAYMLDNEIKSMVLGVSGGIDSTIVAAICSEVSKITNIPLIGISMPTKHNTEAEIKTADKVLTAFCENTSIFPIDSLYESVRLTITDCDTFENKIANGNIQARLRMIKLYDTAYKTGGLVMSTDNYTEYMLGFWTLHGDVGDFGPIQNLFKTEVYNIASYLVNKYTNSGKFLEATAINESAHLKPTDGLGISDGDEAQLGLSYDKIDNILESLKYYSSSKFRDVEDVSICDIKKILKRVNKSEFKRCIPVSVPTEVVYYTGIKDVKSLLKWDTK